MNWLPAANICLGLCGFVWLLMRTTRRWSEYPDEIRKLLAVLLAVFFALLSTSVEMARRPDQLLAAACVISAVKLFTVWVLYTTRTTKYRTGTRTANGNPGADQNRNVA